MLIPMQITENQANKKGRPNEKKKLEKKGKIIILFFLFNWSFVGLFEEVSYSYYSIGLFPHK